MEKKLSIELKDLFNKIFQIDPVKRISMKDMEEHPWM
jgi:serine/threonine protein kinase